MGTVNLKNHLQHFTYKRRHEIDKDDRCTELATSYGLMDCPGTEGWNASYPTLYLLPCLQLGHGQNNNMFLHTPIS
jgi:hypothetical protein